MPAEGPAYAKGFGGHGNLNDQESMASLIQGYEYDIFISYRQKDNRADQWVTNFVKALKDELDATFKEEISIYFDSNPHDGLLETHDVDGSLKDKIKCFLFIPIVSQTYCDPKSFAWQKEFMAFVDFARNDQVGMDIKLPNGNVAKRVLPIRIHDIDEADKKLFEEAIGGVMRPVDFIYKEPGVNRPLTPADNRNENLNRTDYRNQVNKVANAAKELIANLKSPALPSQSASRPAADQPERRGRMAFYAGAIVLLTLASFGVYKYFNSSIAIDASQASIAVIPFFNNSGNTDIDWYGTGIANEIRTQLSLSRQFDFISSMQATIGFRNSTDDPRAIGKKLGVTHILNGAYQLVNNEARVTVELVDAATGKIVWSLPYKTTLNDVGNLQAAIATEVINRFKAEPAKPIVPGAKINLEAFAEYSKGLQFVPPGTFADGLKATQYFQRAIELDPDFLPAHAWLVRITASMVNWDLTRKDSIWRLLNARYEFVEKHFPESWEKNEIRAAYQVDALNSPETARLLYLKVLSENPDSYYANYDLGYVYSERMELATALKYVSRAIKLNARPEQWVLLGLIYAYNGDYRNAELAFQSSNEPLGQRMFYNLVLRYQTKPEDIPLAVREAVGLVGYRFDSLEYKRNFTAYRTYAKSLLSDTSIFLLDMARSNIVFSYYIQRKDDSARYFARTGLRPIRKNLSNLNSQCVMRSVLGDLRWVNRTRDSVFARLPANDLGLERLNWDRDMIRYAAYALDYKTCTELLVKMNRENPQIGFYNWLANPLFDRIKADYPPFVEAMNNLKLPPKLSELPQEKM